MWFDGGLMFFEKLVRPDVPDNTEVDWNYAQVFPGRGDQARKWQKKMHGNHNCDGSSQKGRGHGPIRFHRSSAGNCQSRFFPGFLDERDCTSGDYSSPE